MLCTPSTTVMKKSLWRTCFGVWKSRDSAVFTDLHCIWGLWRPHEACQSESKNCQDEDVRMLGKKDARKVLELIVKRHDWHDRHLWAWSWTHGSFQDHEHSWSDQLIRSDGFMSGKSDASLGFTWLFQVQSWTDLLRGKQRLEKKRVEEAKNWTGDFEIWSGTSNQETHTGMW